jgi:hypothetical protein
MKSNRRRRRREYQRLAVYRANRCFGEMCDFVFFGEVWRILPMALRTPRVFLGR